MGATTRQTFTAAEKSAMKDRAAELKSASKKRTAEQAEQEVLAKIAGMGDADRARAERVHAVVTAAVPGIEQRLWYGMPAYAVGGKIVCHFQPAEKFKARYATLGFSDVARLDDGEMWPAAYALTEVTDEVAGRIEALVRRAVS